MRGSDLWWHIASGQWMLRHRALPLADPWSFTEQGGRWLHHEWLSDVIYAVWVEFFGMQSLAFWKWGMIVVTYLLVLRAIRLLGSGWLAAYLAVLLGIAAAAPFLDVRPHLYSLLGFALLLHLALLPSRRRWLLVLLFLVWANIHGGFFFGLLALGGILLPEVIHGTRRERISAVLTWLACALIALINPNGIEAFTYPLKYAGDSSSPFRSLREWHPPYWPGGIRSPVYWPALTVFVVAGMLTAGRSLRRTRYVVLFVISQALIVAPLLVQTPPLPWLPPMLALLLGISWGAVWLSRGEWRRGDGVVLTGFLLGALTLAMSLRSRRFIPLFGISQALVVAPLFASGLAWIQKRIPAWPAPAAAVLLGLFWLAPYPQRSYAFHYLTVEDSFPVDACDFIETNQLSGRIFAYYNWGGYLHLRTAGRMKVYIDGRADTVFDADTYNRYVDVLSAKPGWIEIVESSGADYFLWPIGSGPQPLELARTGRWVLLYRDGASLMLVRKGLEPEGVVPPADSAYRYLGLGLQTLDRTPWPCSGTRCTESLQRAEAQFARSLEMLPHLGKACFGMAQVQAMQGRTEEASQTMQRCEKIYPFPSRRRAFDSLLERIESTREGGP